jgi:hypothetical protein
MERPDDAEGNERKSYRFDSGKKASHSEKFRLKYPVNRRPCKKAWSNGSRTGSAPVKVNGTPTSQADITENPVRGAG